MDVGVKGSTSTWSFEFLSPAVVPGRMAHICAVTLITVKLLLYFLDPNLPDVGEIEDVFKYVVAYTGKRNHTSQQEKTAIQDLITG